LAAKDLRLKAGWWVLPAVAVVIIALDQFTKYLVVSRLGLYESWAPFPALAKWLEVYYITNTGVAFGLLQGGGRVYAIIPLLIGVGIALYYRTLSAGQWLIRLSLGLQFSGAIGNVIDRLRIGHVIDFIHVPYWPVFNVADSAVSVGTVLLVLFLLREEWREHKEGAGSVSTDSVEGVSSG
jgi:signal peptidase II